MNNYQVKLTDKGFLKLNYYIEEEVALEYTQTPTERSSVDVWIYDLLARISKKNLTCQEQSLEKIGIGIYHLDSENIPKPFQKAVEYLVNSNFIEWLSV